eukprot:362562-Chlamydomonas_euryale.AAC.2
MFEATAAEVQPGSDVAPSPIAWMAWITAAHAQRAMHGYARAVQHRQRLADGWNPPCASGLLLLPN